MELILTQDEALVLFELLARLDAQDAFPCEDQAERQVLWRIHGQLEKSLAEPFREDYQAIIERARERVRSGRRGG